jgi:hypothetical protein
MAQLNNYVTVRNGAVLLWRSGSGSPLATIARNAQNAVVQGDSVIVQFRNGRAVQFRITPRGSNAFPVRTLA